MTTSKRAEMNMRQVNSLGRKGAGRVTSGSASGNWDTRRQLRHSSPHISNDRSYQPTNSAQNRYRTTAFCMILNCEGNLALRSSYAVSDRWWERGILPENRFRVRGRGGAVTLDGTVGFFAFCAAVPPALALGGGGGFSTVQRMTWWGRTSNRYWAQYLWRSVGKNREANEK